MTSLQENRAKAEAYIAQRGETGVMNHINGQSVPAADGATFQTISPVDLRKLADVAHGKSADIDAAVAAAKAAFPAWRDMPGAKRRKILHAVADLL